MKIIICTLMIAIAFSANAQMDHRDKPRDHRDKMHDGREKMMKFIPSMTRTLGGTFQTFDGLNGRIAGNTAYKQLKNYTATLGLGWMHEVNHFMWGPDITIGSSMSGHHDEKSSTIHYVSANLNFGYDVLQSKMVSVYPLVGVGLQKYQAIFYRDNTSVNFNTIITDPAVQSVIAPVKFKNDFVVYHAGIGVAFKSPKAPSNSIGLQAGYTGSFRKNDWMSNEGQTLGNAPEDKISQFYISLILTSKPWMMMRGR